MDETVISEIFYNLFLRYYLYNVSIVISITIESQIYIYDICI